MNIPNNDCWVYRRVQCWSLQFYVLLQLGEPWTSSGNHWDSSTEAASDVHMAVQLGRWSRRANYPNGQLDNSHELWDLDILRLHGRRRSIANHGFDALNLDDNQSLNFVSRENWNRTPPYFIIFHGKKTPWVSGVQIFPAIDDGNPMGSDAPPAPPARARRATWDSTPSSTECNTCWRARESVVLNH